MSRLELSCTITTHLSLYTIAGASYDQCARKYATVPYSSVRNDDGTMHAQVLQEVVAKGTVGSGCLPLPML